METYTCCEFLIWMELNNAWLLGSSFLYLAARYWGLSQSRRKLRLRTASAPRHSGKADCCLGHSPLGRIMIFHSQRISWKSPRIEGLNDFLPITLGMVGTRSSRPGSLRWDYPDYPAGRKLARSHGVNPWVDVAGGDQDPGQSKHFFLLGFRRVLCVVLYLCHTLHPFCSSHIPHTLSNSWPPFL